MRKYHTFNYPLQTNGGKTLLTGIRGVNNSNKVYISGFYKYPDNSNVDAFVFKGKLNSQDLKDQDLWYVLSYPSSINKTVTTTNLYGPNNGENGKIQVVGNYTTKETGNSTIGCLYEGYLSGKGQWTTLIPKFSSESEPTLNTIAHSTNGNLVVGNYDTELIQAKAFIYDILKKKYYDIIKPNAKSITAYGIWYNGDNTYTICGGYSDLDTESGIDSGYLVDWNNVTLEFSNWKSYSYNNQPKNAIVTHFDGITDDGCGGYNLTGDWIGIEENSSKLGFFANVKRNKYGKFKRATWSEVSFPGKTTLTSGNSVFQNVVIGVYTVPQKDSINGYISYLDFY